MYFCIETLFAATKLPPTFVEMFVSALMENQPMTAAYDKVSSDDELMIVGYTLALS